MNTKACENFWTWIYQQDPPIHTTTLEWESPKVWIVAFVYKNVNTTQPLQQSCWRSTVNSDTLCKSPQYTHLQHIVNRMKVKHGSLSNHQEVGRITYPKQPQKEGRELPNLWSWGMGLWRRRCSHTNVLCHLCYQWQLIQRSLINATHLQVPMIKQVPKPVTWRKDRLPPDRRQNKQFLFYLFFQMGHDMGHQENKGRKTNGSQTARKPGSIACSPESYDISTVVDCCQK
jgi:hypothetical protein